VGGFVVVTGIGHAATKWLAELLHRPRRNVVAYHEPLMDLVPKEKNRWANARRLEMDEGAECPPKYRKFVEREIDQHRIAIDVISWLPLATITVLNKWFDANRTIFIVRHGVPQLHSISTKSLWGQYNAGDFLYAEYLRCYWELIGAPGKDWGKWTRWEMLCLWWSTNVFVPDMATRYGQVEVCRMEDLTQDTACLKSLCHTFELNVSIDELVELQGKDINRKVDGDRTPETLWDTWTQEQRSAFRRICGPGMEELGYDVP